MHLIVSVSATVERTMVSLIFGHEPCSNLPEDPEAQLRELR
jgi:hypothetical protein